MDLKATSLVTVLLLCSCSDDDAKSGKPVNHPCETNSDCADSICHSGVCASPSPNANGEIHETAFVPGRFTGMTIWSQVIESDGSTGVWSNGLAVIVQ